jgi:hypothetical protein
MSTDYDRLSFVYIVELGELCIQNRQSELCFHITTILIMSTE